MSVANWIAGGALVVSVLSGVIAWQATERSDVASLTKLEAEQKSLADKNASLAEDIKRVEAIIADRQAGIEDRTSQIESALATVIGKYNSENSIRISVAEYESDYLWKQAELRNRIIAMCDRKRECQVDLSEARYQSFGSSRSKLLLKYRCGTTPYTTSVAYQGRIDINCL
jgi:hypothetical protein